jgi:predicted RNA-binding Zn-ribbon protein involved in translation (DUF1610 family)
MSPTTDLACSGCGGPLKATGNEVRVTCPFCGAMNDIASEGAVRVAKKLDQLGIRVPERPMSVSDIEADFARKAAEENAKRRTAIIVAAVLSAVFLVILFAVLLAAS